MTPFEKIKEYDTDFEKLKIKGLQSEKNAIKKLKKCKVFPALYLVNYKVMSSGNEYVLYYYANNNLSLEKPYIGYLCKSIDEKGKRIFLNFSMVNYAHNKGDEYTLTPRVDEYTMHFVSRYRMRIFGNKIESLDEVMCRYLIANYIGIPTQLNENIMKKYKKYGEIARYGMKVNKGFCLLRTVVELSDDLNTGKKRAVAMGVTNVTFIDNKSLKDGQVVALQKENFNYCKMLSEENRPYINREKYLSIKG